MLTHRLLMPALVATVLAVPSLAAPAVAQDFAPHRAVYTVTALDRGKPGGGRNGTYAYELRLTCDNYVITQRLRLEMEGARTATVSEQQTQLIEGRDGRKLHFEHRNAMNGRITGTFMGDAALGDDGRGQSRFSKPEGQTVALPVGTLFPVALARSAVRHSKAGDNGFDGLFFFGEKVKPPLAVNVLIGRVPKRLADIAIPAGGEALVEGQGRIFFRAGFFDADPKAKAEQATFEMSSLTLDNGIELYGTHEEADGGIEYRVTRLEPLPRPTCN